MNKKTQWFFIGLLALLVISTFAYALPAGPVITYQSNSTAQVRIENRSQDEKGTITVITMDLLQQDYKWKAYVGNVTGRLALDDANAKSIYDWELSTISGEVYASRASSINWADLSCVSQAVINAEQTALGFATAIPDNINSTFQNTVHTSFLVGTETIANSTCRAIATYVNDSAQAIDESAKFQEILLKDDINNAMVYATLINNDELSYNGVATYDFQLLLAENESSLVPTLYYFYVELG